MNDVTTPPDEDAPAEQTAVEPAPTTPAEPVPFWHRPNIERYVVPIFLPVAVVLGILVFVISLSRIFLAGHGHIPVITGSVILLLIFVGATVLSSAAHRLRQSSLVLVTVGFILAISLGGLLVLGHSEAEKSAAATTLPCTLKTTQHIDTSAAPGGDLKFQSNTLTGKTGLAKMNVKVDSAGHTFALEDPTTQFQTLSLDTAGAVVSCVAFFPKAGQYNFECTVDSHAANGMVGVINITGPAMTLAQAEKAAGN